MNPSQRHIVRPATRADLEFVVWTMRTAATSHLDHSVWDTLLGRPSGDIDRLFASVAQSESVHWCHLSRFWILEVAGEPAGALSTFDTASEGSAVLEHALLMQAAGLDLSSAEVDQLGERGEILRDVTPNDFPDTWGVENVAVVERFRGAGVVDALLTHALQVGRERGYQYSQILCLIGNRRAQRSWERHGFQVHADYRNERFQQIYGCPGLRLLHRRL